MKYGVSAKPLNVIVQGLGECILEKPAYESVEFDGALGHDLLLAVDAQDQLVQALRRRTCKWFLLLRSLSNSDCKMVD
jgi:hypothetical protein